MMRRSIAALVAILASLACSPALAGPMEPSPQASASYNPWVAAGLTYVPMALDAALVGLSTGITSPGYPQTAALVIALNPTPGLGHGYVGEPLRGLAIFGTSLAMGLGTLAANLALYQGRPATGVEPRWQDNVRESVNIGYVASSAILSAWAAWDAYRIAEEKNRASDHR